MVQFSSSLNYVSQECARNI